MSSKYLVTIDREEWGSARLWEFWKSEWHAERGRRFEKIQGIGRTVFEVDRSTSCCRALFQLPQLLDEKVLRESWSEQSAWTKGITRGLRAITPLKDGTLIINDIFGVYHTNRHGDVLNYVTSKRFADVHCATPNQDNSRLMVASTGTEELLEIDWEGRVHREIHLPDLFELPISPRLRAEYARHPDRRFMRLDHTRELFHVNWVEWLGDGTSVLVSCHQPGLVLVIDLAGQEPKVAKQWGYYPQCHGPSLLGDEALFISVSKTDEVVEVDPLTGRRRWTASGMGYSKRVLPLDGERALACDCNGKRLVELSRKDGSVLWECGLPGLPFAVACVEQGRETSQDVGLQSKSGNILLPRESGLITHRDKGQTASHYRYRSVSEVWRFNRGMITKIDHAVASLGGISPVPRKVLEVGCGVGTVCLPLASLGHRVVAVDLDKESVEFARRKAQSHGISSVDFRCGWLHEVVDADRSFDWVILGDVLEHLEAPVDFLKMLKGYLRPGGAIWISVPNEHTSLAHHVPTYQVAMALKLFALKLVPRSVKSQWHKHEPKPYERSSTREFRPLYFNYSLNDHSPHLQKFTFRTIQSTVREAGYELVRIDGGSMFYKIWPLHAVMDRFISISLADQRLAQMAKAIAGDLWVVAKDPSAEC